MRFLLEAIKDDLLSINLEIIKSLFVLNFKDKYLNKAIIILIKITNINIVTSPYIYVLNKAICDL